MALRRFFGLTASLIGLCGSWIEPAAGQLSSPAAPEPGCLDRAALTSSPAATCSQIMALSHLRPSSLPGSAEGSARSGSGAGKGAMIGLGVGLAAGVVSAAVFASGCEENQSSCTAVLIVGGAALGAGTGALIGAIASSGGGGWDTTASRTQVTLSGGYLHSPAYFTGSTAPYLTTSDAFVATAQMSLAIHPSWAVVLGGSYASPEWLLPGVPPPGSMSITGAKLWFIDAALRWQHRLGASSPRATRIFVQAGPGFGYYSLNVTLQGQLYDDDTVNPAAALGAGLVLPLSRRFGVEVTAKDYIVSFDPPDASFGLEGQTAHTLLLVAGAHLGL